MATDLFSQQRANRRKSQWLVAGFVLFFMWLGFGGDWLLAQFAAGEGPARLGVPWVGLATTSLAGGFCWWSWRRGPQAVLRAAGAREVVEAVTPDERRFVNVAEEMAIAAGLPRPRLYVVADPDPNAFATGRDPQSAAIAVTDGLLRLLDRDELQAVVAHEMAHVRNLDVRLMTLMAAMVGAIAMLADLSGRALRGGARLGGGRGGRGGGAGRDGGAAPLLVLLLVVWLLSWLLAPLVSRLLAMAVSRKREYLADATAAQLTRNPAALASALAKVDGAPGATRSLSRSAAHLCIVDPGERRLSAREGRLGDLFASHPPIRVRIARLRAMAYRSATADAAG